MKHIFLCLLLGCSVYTLLSAQERIDTLFYTKSGQKAPNQLFAEYYRIALYPADSTSPKMFKDFYRTGETRCEGNFLSIDSTDDMRSVFDGDIVMFNKNGTAPQRPIMLTANSLANFYNTRQRGLYRYRHSTLTVKKTVFKKTT